MIRKLIRRLIPQPIRAVGRRVVGAFRYVVYGSVNGRQKYSDLVGMTSPAEREFYETCVADVSGVEGAVVDLGCWMCSTTIPLVHGVMRESSNLDNPQTKVYAFDRFVWEDWMDGTRSWLFCNYLPGESFLPEARGRLGTLCDRVELVRADLTDYDWTGGSIRILLVDAMKSPELAQSIAGNFFPSLVEGALVVHQDYKHFYTPWIHLLQYRLRECFRVHHEVEDGATVAFKTLRPVAKERAFSAAQYRGVSNDELEKAIEYSHGLVGLQGRSGVAAAHVMHYVHTGQDGAARRVLDSYSGLSHPPAGEFSRAEEMVRTLGQELPQNS